MQVITPPPATQANTIAQAAVVPAITSPAAHGISELVEMVRAGAHLGMAAPDATSDAIIAAMVPEPPGALKLTIRAVVSKLVERGIWAKLDLFYFCPVHSQQAACLNWINPGTNTLTIAAGQSFTAYKGFQGTGGGTAYLDTGYTPGSGGNKFSQNAAFFGVWVGSELTENKDDAGSPNCVLRSRYSGAMVFRVNSSVSSNGGVVAGAPGFVWANRFQSTSYDYGRNAANLGTITDTSVAPPAGTLKFGGGNVAGSSGKRQVAFVAGGSLTNTDVATLYACLSGAKRIMDVDTYTITPSITYQTLDGIGGEIQADSIESDSGGFQESNTSNLIADLSGTELTRFANNIMSIPEGGKFATIRLAAGLYWRGVTADGKNYQQKFAGQNAGLYQCLGGAGVTVAYLHWSPAPFWKRIAVATTTFTCANNSPTITVASNANIAIGQLLPAMTGIVDGTLVTNVSGTTISISPNTTALVGSATSITFFASGGNTTVPDKTANPTGWNTYLRQLLQGGVLDAPDKTSRPTQYATWMDAFTSAVVTDMEYVHTNIGCVRYFSPQNEPAAATNVNAASYSACGWSDQQYYDFLKAIVPKIQASATLSTYAGQANTVRIYCDSFNGQTGKGSALILADSTLLSQIYGWAWHDIVSIYSNAAYVRENASKYTTGAAGKPVFCDENEYFDPIVTPANAAYQPDGWRFANTVLMPLYWFVYANAPIWFWIHVGKPSNASDIYEMIGRGLAAWRPPAAGASAQYPALAASSWTYITQNWNAIRPYLRWMPAGSVRIDCVAAEQKNDVHAMAWKRPDGKIVVAMVNRSTGTHTFTLVGSTIAASFAGYRYDSINADVSLGTKVFAGAVEMNVPAYTAEFWVQQ